MASLMRLFRREERSARTLYDGVVALARQAHWYRDGGVPDTVEGRFSMLATLLALLDLRLEGGGEEARFASVSLAECFIDDMDGELREMGVSDPAMQKKVGGLVGALGGRIGAWRDVVNGTASWEATVGRSVYRGHPPPTPAAREHVERQLRAFWAGLQARTDEALTGGVLP